MFEIRFVFVNKNFCLRSVVGFVVILCLCKVLSSLNVGTHVLKHAVRLVVP